MAGENLLSGMLALIAAETGSPAAPAARRNVTVSSEVGSRKVQ
eukprot:COSAG02_NODE_59474_length_274_cov_0.594286_2_plen_42_part_01